MIDDITLVYPYNALGFNEHRQLNWSSLLTTAAIIVIIMVIARTTHARLNI